MEPLLAPLREGDEALFRSIARQPHVLRFLPDMEMTAGYAAQLAAYSRQSACFSPCEQMRLYGIYQQGTLVGALTLGPVYEADYRVTVGFFVGQDHLGHGIASAAVRQALAVAATFGADQVAALVELSNHTSLALLKALGFREEKRLGMRRSGEREKRETCLMVCSLAPQTAPSPPPSPHKGD